MYIALSKPTVIALEEPKPDPEDGISDNVVISTGGGIIETPENRAILKNSSTFYLNGDMQKIYERAAKRRSERPLMENMDYDGFLKLFEDRDRMYKECSKQEITIDNKDIAEIANEIINYERN